VHGRHDLPWQGTRDAYRIWLSEVMLQQTQVTTALPYYERFLVRFPDARTLADASLDDVLAHWAGLGYYRRAHHLHAAAKAVVAAHAGVFPVDAATLATLPGIGRSTAAAIATFAAGAREAILDGNVKRVLARHRGIAGFPGAPKVERELWSAAESLLPAHDVEAYTQGLMDLGATICVRARPRCLLCPVAADCVARLEGRVDELPQARPARATPRREVQLLVCVRGDEVLLERRPSTGLWSGLWSFPEVPMGEDVEPAVRSRVGGRVLGVTPLPPLTHAFTHFTLTMRPSLARVAKPREAAEGERWLTLQDAAALALPAPIRRLLATLDLPASVRGAAPSATPAPPAARSPRRA
jgi:A/G-specific adenine glycosylase